MARTVGRPMTRECRAGRWVPRGRRSGWYAWQRGPCGTSSLESERARMARRPVVLRHPPACFGQVARLLLREEAGEAHVHDRAEANELVDVHGALPVEDVPEALSVHIDSASSATLMPRSCRARSILATIRSAWFIRFPALKISFVSRKTRIANSSEFL